MWKFNSRLFVQTTHPQVHHVIWKSSMLNEKDLFPRLCCFTYSHHMFLPKLPDFLMFPLIPWSTFGCFSSYVQRRKPPRGEAWFKCWRMQRGSFAVCFWWTGLFVNFYFLHKVGSVCKTREKCIAPGLWHLLE